MFIDSARVTIKAGDGGNGYVSFRQEKFVDRGGPDGGDGGDGGDVVLVASRNQNTLASFRYQKELVADSGKAGFKQNMHGRSGADLIVAVPVGTMVIDESGTYLADLIADGQRAIIASGGKGGFGNAHFVSSTRQAPRVAEKGEPGQVRNVTLELKLIADVGLVGLPNAGKSTLISVVSNARPEIANYPFTTIRPNLGVVDIDKESSLLFADIPGLIEGASLGKGLGDEFLRHIERTAAIIHLIDIYNDDIVAAYHTIQGELRAYKIDLTLRPQIVVLSKIDGLDDDIITDALSQLQAVVPAETPLMAISAQSGKGLKPLLYEVKSQVERVRSKQAEDAVDNALPVITIDTADSWHVDYRDNVAIVTGRKIERFARRTDFSSYHGVQRLRDIMRKMGIMHGLDRKGVQPGEVVHVGSPSLGSFEY